MSSLVDDLVILLTLTLVNVYNVENILFLGCRMSSLAGDDLVRYSPNTITTVLMLVDYVLGCRMSSLAGDLVIIKQFLVM